MIYSVIISVRVPCMYLDSDTKYIHGEKSYCIRRINAFLTGYSTIAPSPLITSYLIYDLT